MDTAPSAALRVRREHFDDFFAALKARGYRVVGPTLRESAIACGDLDGADDLPIGWTDTQDAGTYRLKRRGDNALFGYSVGPHSWKQFLLEPRLKLMTMRRNDSGFTVEEACPEVRKLAIIGARSCDLHAIAIQDRVLLEGPCADATYARRRADLFVIAVQCGRAGGTCFCLSMQTGPHATKGFDVALTEVLAPEHVFMAEVGSEAGADLMRNVRHEAASSALQAEAERIVAETARQMGRRMDTNGIQDLLYRNREHPRWDDVAKRCLACTNCTLVCPTCFCTTVEDVTDLTGREAERVRRWDSCYTLDFSYLHGGSVRSTHRARYRQWLTHKLASWFDQFDSSGCVGCGRCITWCPVGIDLTEEVRALRESHPRPQGAVLS